MVKCPSGPMARQATTPPTPPGIPVPPVGRGMAPFKDRFLISDLAAFSGIKAHTIRMWEKRHGLLDPARTDTNIRTYGLKELKALLNVAYLNRNGHKISRIAALSPAERERLVAEVASSRTSGSDVLNSLKLAMIGFDEVLFESASDRFRQLHGLRALVERVYVPFLEQVGLLWQANAICPAQEHFVSNLIRHRLIAATASLPLRTASHERVFVLYLPENEIHELGLLYVDHILRARGERTIYLGQSVPTEDLVQVVSMLPQQVVLVSMLMVRSLASEVPGMLKELRKLIPDERVTFWMAGAQFAALPDPKPPSGIVLHHSMASLIAAVDGL